MHKNSKKFLVISFLVPLYAMGMQDKGSEYQANLAVIASRTQASLARVEDIAYEFRDLVADEILRQRKDYREYEIDIAKKIGTPEAHEWIEKRKREIPQENLLFKAINDGDESKVDSLLKSGVRSNAIFNDGTPALYVAATYIRPNLVQKRSAIVKILLRHNADTNRADLRGTTALHDVVSAEVAQLLLNRSAQINVKNKHNQTPLITHVHWKENHEWDQYFAIMQLLLAAGADANVISSSGQTALDFAEYVKNDSAVDLLKRYKAKRGSELK